MGRCKKIEINESALGIGCVHYAMFCVLQAYSTMMFNYCHPLSLMQHCTEDALSVLFHRLGSYTP